MLAVVLDTNALHSDPWLTSDTGEKLTTLAQHGKCSIVYPQVVVDELLRQRREAADRGHKAAEKGLREMAKAGVDVTKTQADLEAAFARIEIELKDAFTAVLAKANVGAAPVPSVSASDLLERDLERRRPFMEVGEAKKKSVGFRDTLIWETVLEMLAADQDMTGVFVTDDKGFLSEDGDLHPDLLADLDARGIDRGRVATVKNVFNAVSAVSAAAEKAARITAATEALYALVGESAGVQLQYGGDYGFPDFVEFKVPRLDDPIIYGIDQLTEFELVEDRDVITATCDAEITFEGAVYKSDWYIDESGSVSIGGELNSHMFEASGYAAVRVVVQLEQADDEIAVSGIVLRDLPKDAAASSDA
ncbi:MAG: hypothetical protein FJW64_07285 [Actinobacteria bacterium]|nr:hypothetical protein [Actinomycetota bacterium]